MKDLQFAQYLAGIFRDRDIRTVIDVGANAGQYHDFARHHVGFTGQIFSYEPDPGCFAELQRRPDRDSAWEKRNLALGSETGVLPLNIMTETVFSSFLAPTHDHVDMSLSGNEVRDRVLVSVSTLAEEWSRENFRDGVYLKLDTQGFDLNVLRGAGPYLDKCLALQTELSMQPIYENMPSFDEVMSYLEKRGFALGATFPVSRDEHGAIVELDGVFVQK